MAGTFELRQSSDNQFYFSLKASGGTTLLTGEGHPRKATAQAGIQSVKANAPLDSRYERKTSTDNRYYFTLKAANGEPLGRSLLFGTAKERDAAVEATKSDTPDAQVLDITGT